MNNPMKLFCLASLALAIPAAHAAIVAPYTVDANTLHLWHFDEADNTATTTADAAGGISLNKASGATLGSASFSGFGRAGNTSADQNAEFLSTDTLVPPVGIGGAFTYEAMINIANITSLQQIFSMDGSGTRPFQFRVLSGNLEFINIAGGSTISAAIPTVGADAFVANQWFHVAATYNGAANTVGNFNLYWTLVNESRTAANLIHSGNMTADLTTANSARYGVGNDNRTSGGQDKNLEGLIDEVRISGIARGADDMLFAIPEPSTALLGSLGLLALLRRRR